MNEANDNEISYHYNSANHSIQINTVKPLNKNTTTTVYDALGKIVIQKFMNAGEIKYAINVAALQSAIYYLGLVIINCLIL